ncbi:hypothetical protein VP137E351_P0056 [Vibrio phage 137E35-1]|nr:hypothetical protein VP137E351_P0056 [Vibrio phage 137E35-1]CAH9016501.1 hypothetical protein VP230E391_P0056 [Vibrio phage 230E39-1]
MELKDHLTATIDPFTAFYLKKANESTNPSEALSYMTEAQRRIKSAAEQEEKQSEKVRTEVKSEV